MLSDTLNTNQVKNSSGVEQEFGHLESIGRSRTYAKVGESPALPHRLNIRHQETGEGLKRVRRSVTDVTKQVMSDVDPTYACECRAYLVLVSPVGALTTMAEPTNTLANLLSAVASTGADTAIKFDGSGTFAAAMLGGSI